MVMVVDTGMPLSSLLPSCEAATSGSSTLGISTQTSETSGGPDKIWSVYGNTSRRKEGRSGAHGQDPRYSQSVSPSITFILFDADLILDHTLKNRTQKFSHILGAGSIEEYWHRLRELAPYEYVMNHERLEYYGNKTWAAERVAYTPLFTDFVRVPEEMRKWTEEEMVKPLRPKTLVVWGPSRTGKTEWARSLSSNHCYFGSLFNVSDVDEDCDYCVMDDMDLDYLHNYKCWFGKSLAIIYPVKH